MKKCLLIYYHDIMEKDPLIRFTERKCTGCYTCVRVCPVKAIQIDSGNMNPVVNDSRCIGCGACVESCYSDALTYRSSIDEAREILSGNNTVVAICSPGISAEFDDITDYRKFVQMIKALGIKYVHEESFGVDLIAYEYLDLLQHFKGKYYINSNDPVVVSYIEKFHPNLVSNLTPLVSPAIAMTQVIRNIYKESVKVMYIGSDIAVKEEAKRFDGDRKIDVVLTFVELRKLFEEFGIDEGTLEFSEFDAPLGYKGSLYPIRNGLLQAADMDENLLTSNITCVEGRKAMLESIDEFEKHVKTIQHHLYVVTGNLLKGAGTTNRAGKLLREHFVVKYANKRLLNFFRIEWHNNLQEFLELDFSYTFKANDQRLPAPSAEKVKEVLKLLGRKATDRIGCTECGFESCKDFAIAVAKGLTVPELCITYSLKHSKNRNEEVEVVAERLRLTENLLEETRKKAQQEKDTAELASELNDFIFEKLRAGVVLVDNSLKVIKANGSFIRILGQEAEEINEVIPGLVGADLHKLVPHNLANMFSYVLSDDQNIDGRDIQLGESLINVSLFPVSKHQVVGGIIRDMQAPEVQKAEVMNRISEAIDKNLEMVQKIGFLMGEGASDIEKMLNSIIEFYNTNKEPGS